MKVTMKVDPYALLLLRDRQRWATLTDEAIEDSLNELVEKVLRGEPTRERAELAALHQQVDTLRNALEEINALDPFYLAEAYPIARKALAAIEAGKNENKSRE